jgi:hypothetical protein
LAFFIITSFAADISRLSLADINIFTLSFQPLFSRLAAAISLLFSWQ